MMSLNPFKIRPGKDGACLDVARQIFGEPVDSIIEYHIEKRKTSLLWHFYEDIVEANLWISHWHETNFVEISFSEKRMLEDMTICGRYSPNSTKEKLRKFVEAVKKPWPEWGADEIMSDPMWICFYKEEGNEPTPAMENMMHMLSFQRPEDKWVKRYFGKRG